MLGIYRMIRLGSPKRETLMLLNRWDCGAPIALIADDSQDSMQFQLFSKSVYVCTDCNAPNKRICKLNLECPTLDEAQILIPETTEKIQWWKVVGERIFVTYVRGLVNVTEIFDLEGAPMGSVQYPADGSAERMCDATSYTVSFIAVLSTDVEDDKMDFLSGRSVCSTGRSEAKLEAIRNT